MDTVNIALLNAERNEKKEQRPLSYRGNSSLDPFSNIAIFIRAGEFMLSKFEEIEHHTTQFIATEDTEIKSEMRRAIAPLVEKCLAIVYEFKLGFSVPDDYPDRKELELFLYRFLQLEEQIELYHAGLRIPYLQQAQETVRTLVQDFQKVRDNMQDIVHSNPANQSSPDNATNINTKVSV